MRALPALLLLAVAPALAQAPAPDAAAPPTAYVGGQWWDGERFEARDTTWAEGGVFVAERPGGAARVVDVGGTFVVPPFGDAHTHMLADTYSAGLADSLYVDRGVFYALVLNNAAGATGEVRGRAALPDGIDVAYANGGITSTGSHPGPLYERIWRNEDADPDAARDDTTAWSGHRIVYWFWDTLAHVEAEWDAYLATRPDLVKVYLSYNERCDGRPTPRGCGLRPEVATEVVRRAHAAGLRVAAHVNTEDDVRRAVAAGADLLAHLPSGNDGVPVDDERYWLTDETVRLLADAGTTVIPTASLLTEDLATFRTDTLQAEVARQRHDLRRLHAAGVPLALGADSYFTTSAREAGHLAAYVFDAATVLRLWSETTPQTVFPDRAVGRLAPGYEASLLALACDPTGDWSCTAEIAHREKQGLALGGADMAETAAAWRALDVARFTAPPAPGDGPLLRGLKAYVDADHAGAQAALREALNVAPDSLRPFVRGRLADIARGRFEWAEAVRLQAEDDPGAGRSIEAGFARFPAARMRLDAPETTVPFDGLRVPAAVNGVPVRAVVDTGAPGTGVPRALVERLGLRVDTTARGVSRVPSMGLEFDVYAVLLDSVTVGEATFYNVPATVGWREDGAADEIFLGADVFRHLAGGLRYDYADSTFTVLRDVPETAAPPTFLVDGGGAPVVPVTVGGAAANAIVDTGNQTPVYLARGAFDLAGVLVARSASGDGWSADFYALPLTIPGHPALTGEAYEADFVFAADDPVTVILGKTVWAGGALTLDFVNRRVRFEPAAPPPAGKASR